MAVILIPLFQVLNIVIDLFIFALIASAILSWLMAFNILNARSEFVYRLADILHRLTEPALRPIRRIVPAISGLDVSPVILILILYFIQGFMVQLAVRLAVP